MKHIPFDSDFVKTFALKMQIFFFFWTVIDVRERLKLLQGNSVNMRKCEEIQALCLLCAWFCPRNSGEPCWELAICLYSVDWDILTHILPTVCFRLPTTFLCLTEAPIPSLTPSSKVQLFVGTQWQAIPPPQSSPPTHCSAFFLEPVTPAELFLHYCCSPLYHVTLGHNWACHPWLCLSPQALWSLLSNFVCCQDSQEHEQNRLEPSKIPPVWKPSSLPGILLRVLEMFDVSLPFFPPGLGKLHQEVLRV